MPEPVEYPTCGRVTKPDGSIDIVVSGDDVTFLYNSDTRVWRVAEDGENEVDLYGAAAQMSEEDFFIIGGYSGEELDTIYRFFLQIFPP